MGKMKPRESGRAYSSRSKKLIASNCCKLAIHSPVELFPFMSWWCGEEEKDRDVFGGG
jgi:hypothetical protein